MNFLYSSYGDDFESFEGFRAWLLCRNGMAHVKITELEKDGKLYVYQKYLVKSMSFGSCSQKEFHKYFNNLQEFAQHNWSIVFSEWKKEWDEHENTLQ